MHYDVVHKNWVMREEMRRKKSNRSMCSFKKERDRKAGSKTSPAFLKLLWGDLLRPGMSSLSPRGVAMGTQSAA